MSVVWFVVKIVGIIVAVTLGVALIVHAWIKAGPHWDGPEC